MGEEKPQIFFVHGGMTFEKDKDYLNFLKTRSIKINKEPKWWGNYLKRELGKEVQLIIPRMPLQDRAKYEEWKIHFERHFSQLNDNIILIGESLGGIFLARYLSENKFPKKIYKVYLIAPPFDNTIPEEELSEGFELSDDLSMMKENCANINLLFSKNDGCVPLSHSEKYKEKLQEANIMIYENIKGHFEISEFPEMIVMLREDLNLLKNNII